MMNKPSGNLLSVALLLFSPLALGGGDVGVQVGSLYKDYVGSADKSSAREDLLAIDGRFERWRLGASYRRGVIDRFAPVDLRVEKYHVDVGLSLTKDVDWGLSYLVIDDNLAPTDGGKVFGTTMLYRGLAPSMAFKAGYHVSDYDRFDVSQLKLGIIQGIPLEGMKLNIAVGAGYQRLDDPDASPYVANARDHYLSPYLNISAARGPWHGTLGLAGRRLFEVAADGRRVSHHAMEFRRSVTLQVGRHFGALDVRLGLSHHQAEELPQSNRLEMNTIGASTEYRF